MSGRQQKVLNEQAELYGLPIGGSIIDLPSFVRALHDFLAKNARKLQKSDDGDLLGGDSSPALERYRDERAKLAKLERLEREKQLLPREWVHSALAQAASVLRAAGETLQRQCGPDAHEILDEAIGDALKGLDALFDLDGGQKAEETGPRNQEPGAGE